MTEKTRHRRSAVVTGQGMLTPLGRTPDDIWQRWANREIAAGPPSKRELDFYNVPYTAEVRDFEPRKEIKNRKLLRLMVAGEPLGFVAATKAFENAGLTPEDYLPERGGIAIGCHKEGFRETNLYDALDAARREDGSIDRALMIADGIRRIPPQTLVEGLANAALYYLAHEFTLQGVNHNLLSSGSGGMLAIGEAMRSVRRGEADIMLAGAYDKWMEWQCYGHQLYIGVLSRADGPPESLHKPFDRDRSGGIPGEGAGMFILEDREHAAARGAPILGEIVGFAAGHGLGNSDRAACAELYASTIRRACNDAGISPAEIDLIHLQGEGTESSDWIEATAVRRALGDHADDVPATTVTSATGLLGNASGPIEVVMTLEMLRRGEVLPIVNLENVDPGLSLNFVREPLSGRSMRYGLVLQRSWPNHFTALVVTTGANR